MDKATRNYFCPIKIGGLALKNNLIAAPMAGLTSLPYRVLALEMGCALAISEMVSAEGVIRAPQRTRRYFYNDAKARPFGLQLFSAKPPSIALAVRRLEGEPIDLIDINMGCPVKKVCSKGAGVVLMRVPTIAAEIVAAVRRATTLPVTVKMRTGYDDSSINCVEIAKIAEACGADAVIVHARTGKQGYKGLADWTMIGRVKTELKIPVIGNGDVRCREDAIRMICETGCDGVMIGRAALGNPWIFREIISESHTPPTICERGKTIMRHLDMLCLLVGEGRAVLMMRTILPWYGKGLRGIRSFLRGLNRVSERTELEALISSFFQSDGF